MIQKLIRLIKPQKDLLIILGIFIFGSLFLFWFSGIESNGIDSYNKNIINNSHDICHKYAQIVERNNTEQLSLTSVENIAKGKNGCQAYLTYLNKTDDNITNIAEEMRLSEHTMNALDTVLQNKTLRNNR